jgi:hypothetical protein
MRVNVLRNYATYVQFLFKKAASQSKLQKLTKESYVSKRDISLVCDSQLTSVVRGQNKIKLKLRSKIRKKFRRNAPQSINFF